MCDTGGVRLGEQDKEETTGGLEDSGEMSISLLSSSRMWLLESLSKDVNVQGLHSAVGPFLKGQI